MSDCCVFAGQGAQVPGMGKDFAVAGAQLVDDPAAVVLDFQRGGQITGLDALVELDVQLGHGAVGAANAAGGAHDQTGDQLLIGAVEDDGALVTPHLDVLSGHGGVLDADAPGHARHNLHYEYVQQCALCRSSLLKDK